MARKRLQAQSSSRCRSGRDWSPRAGGSRGSRAAWARAPHSASSGASSGICLSIRAYRALRLPTRPTIRHRAPPGEEEGELENAYSRRRARRRRLLSRRLFEPTLFEQTLFEQALFGQALFEEKNARVIHVCEEWQQTCVRKRWVRNGWLARGDLYATWHETWHENLARELGTRLG